MGYFAIKCKDDNEIMGLMGVYTYSSIEKVDAFISTHNHEKKDVLENLQIIWM